MPTFAQNFNIGDVVYGISQSRAPYVNSLGNALRTYCEETGAFLLCDSFNNRSFLGVNASYGLGAGLAPVHSLTNPTNAQDIRHNLDFYEHDRGMTALGEDEKRAARIFYDALDKSERSPSKASTEPQSKWTNHGDLTVTMLMIRRACKFGLEYMLETLQRQVHFVLDVPYNPGVQLDMQDVVDKAKYAGGIASPAGSVPITFSELRCCYRNRAKWIPTGRLKFYLALNEVTAPWVTNPLLWQQYDLARQQKAYKKKHPIKAKLGFGP
ncbi:MAG: hypothetical protein ABI442_06280 [Gemmatimonadaceae bacterium]